ncbi:MAG TPA: phosphatase PAP2 family protein [Terriglobia bacterium]|nr:phosphatase PAP2 family protein [Terriglobia bacterium]
MPNDGRINLRVRLEDAVAFSFFFLYLVLIASFREWRGSMPDPVSVMVVVPAVCLLLGKELVHYFVAGKEMRLESAEGLWEFVKPYWTILHDWLPFFMLLFMYYALWGSATHMVITHDRDLDLIAWDQRLFGFQASVALQRIVSPPLTAWMEFAYFFHLPNIPIVACFIYIWRPRERFREMMTGVLLVTAFGLVGYLLVPGVGPMYSLRDQFIVPLSQPLALFSQQADFIDFARVQRDVFPSLHVGISFVVWLYAYRNSKRLFWILSPFILSLWVSTVYLRYHYLVDVVAGLILAPLCFLLSNWLFKRFGVISIPIRMPEAWASRIRGHRAQPAVGQESSPSEMEERP